MIEHDLTLLVAFLIGYYLGRGRNPKADITTAAHAVIHPIKESLQDDILIGPIKRPSAIELAKRNEPPHIKQQKEAMKETLDQIPELVEAKEAVEKAGPGSLIP